MEKAAGLKICFLPIATIYFDAMATKLASAKNKNPWIDPSGPMTSDKIRAVIYVDSVFEGALKNFSKSLLLKKDEANKIIKEKIISNGPKGISSKKEKIKPATHKKARHQSTSLYIVILFKKLSIEDTIIYLC